MESAKFTQFTTHTPIDNRDPGFALPGFKLRWITSYVTERRGQQRIWTELRPSELPKKLVDSLKSKNPLWFKDGDTIRVGGDVLAYATLDEVKKLRSQINEAQKINEGYLRRASRHGGAVTSKGSVQKASLANKDLFGEE